jgi:hypothetical protein
MRIFVVILIAFGTVACTAEEPPPRAEAEARTGRQGDVLPGAPRGCPREPVPHKRRDVRAVAFARGDGPVYVGLGTGGRVRYSVDTRKHDDWYYYKTLWAISPRYQGEVTVTGHQLDGSHDLRFNPAAGFPGKKLLELVFEETNFADWRYGPSETLIRADGCYAFRVEGEDFVDWVTFIAVRRFVATDLAPSLPYIQV